MRICLVYDCLFPHTIGGAERWYRNLGERLAAEGHDVDYLTLRQWPREAPPEVPGVRVRAVGPRMRLYAGPGRRRILPPLVFGLGVLWHLLRHGRRYDVVHTASFPYFSLLAAGVMRSLYRFQLVVDWHEVWTRSYWREYLGRLGGEVGWTVQLLCTRLPQQAFCFSQLHAQRLVNAGLKGKVTMLPGEYDGPPARPRDDGNEYGPRLPPTIVFAGRHIPEKQILAIPAAISAARREEPSLRGVILGDGPERQALLAMIADLGLHGIVDAPGFVDETEVERTLGEALCLVLPSSREGYGMVVIEAARHGTPSIVVDGPDNAAVELIENGVNGLVARSAEAGELADAILRVNTAGEGLRAATSAWFERNLRRLSLSTSLEIVIGAYAREPSARS